MAVAEERAACACSMAERSAAAKLAPDRPTPPEAGEHVARRRPCIPPGARRFDRRARRRKLDRRRNTRADCSRFFVSLDHAREARPPRMLYHESNRRRKEIRRKVGLAVMLFPSERMLNETRPQSRLVMIFARWSDQFAGKGSLISIDRSKSRSKTLSSRFSTVGA